MKGRESRKERLHKLLDLARLYRGWSRSQLARALNRTVSSIYTESDDPKFSLIVALADALEWPVDSVAEYLYGGDGVPEIAEDRHPDGAEFAQQYKAAQEAYKAGQYRETLAMSRQLLAIASDPLSRARAYNIEFLAWDGMGRFTKARRAIQQALLQSPLPMGKRTVFLVNLANVHYTLWELAAARGIAASILEWYADYPPQTAPDRIHQAHAYYVSGHTYRRQIAVTSDQAQRCAQHAVEDLTRAVTLFSSLAEELDRSDLAAVAHTCKGGLIEAETALGQRVPSDALRELEAGLEPVSGEADWPVGPWLESYGWWSIFGANIALRHTGGDKRQHYLAVFTNKALDIAERLHNVGFDASCWMMEFQRQQAASAADGQQPVFVLDGDDVRRIVGALGDVLWFRPAGLGLLRRAYIIDETGHVIGSAPATPGLVAAAGLPRAS